MAVDWAVEPLRVIAVELPKKFQAWIDTQEIGTDDRPLSHLFGNGIERVLCFNYTEFPELYIISGFATYLAMSKNPCEESTRVRSYDRKRGPSQCLIGYHRSSYPIVGQAKSISS